MEFLLFQIRRIVAIFTSIFNAPGELLGMVWDGSGRSNNLILGLPSVLIGASGFLAVFLMQWGGASAMVEKYSDRVQTNANRQKLLAVDLRQSLISQLSLNSGGASEAEKIQKLRAEDPRTEEIKKLGDESIIYLKKLVALEPQNKDHLFQLAVRFYNRGDAGSQKRALGILNEIAPLDHPGHPEAHLQLARRLEQQPAKSVVDKRANIDAALEHVTQCLTRDARNYEALKVKARLLRLKGATDDSREVFEQLFEENPVYFQPLLELGVSGAKRASILDSAASRYLAELRNKDVREDTIQWVRAWEGVAKVLTQKKDFERLKNLLEKDLREYSQAEETAGRVPFLKQYLCRVYLAWASSEIGDPLETMALDFDEDQQRRLLEFYSKAYSYNEKDRYVLQNIAKLGSSSFPSIVERALQIYNPSTTRNLPPGVLNQIALEALNSGNYREAQQYYERAKTLNPNSPSILNNLAYSYLKEDSGENQLSADERASNASRAHRLVEQAIRLLPDRLKNSDQMSMYRHTMGTALMQLGNYPGAAAQLELALTSRPRAEEVLQSIIDCYELYKLDVGPYQRRLEQVRQDKLNSSVN